MLLRVKNGIGVLLVFLLMSLVPLQAYQDSRQQPTQVAICLCKKGVY
ncbi:hypothetical protein NHP22001_10440 [Helicobacter sp. NHP22-001]|nr:hypothetical protein NHP22001_10440 [Helicobacter sp. NHP22-001]